MQIRFQLLWDSINAKRGYRLGHKCLGMGAHVPEAAMIDLTSLELGIAAGTLGTMILCLATILHHQRRVLRDTREDRRLKP